MRSVLQTIIEYENEQYQRLGSVVTNRGYSDWATTDIDASVKSMTKQQQKPFASSMAVL